MCSRRRRCPAPRWQRRDSRARYADGGSERGGRKEELSFERAEPPEGSAEFECIVVKHMESGLYLSHMVKNLEGQKLRKFLH